MAEANQAKVAKSAKGAVSRSLATLAPLTRSRRIAGFDVEHEERAAILEFEAGYSRPMAETLARLWARSEWRGRE